MAWLVFVVTWFQPPGCLRRIGFDGQLTMLRRQLCYCQFCLICLAWHYRQKHWEVKAFFQVLGSPWELGMGVLPWTPARHVWPMYHIVLASISVKQVCPGIEHRLYHVQIHWHLHDPSCLDLPLWISQGQSGLATQYYRTVSHKPYLS